MSDIQDEAYSEAMDDLERAVKEIGRLKSVIEAQREEILHQKHLGEIYLDLLRHAADGLEDARLGFNFPSESLIKQLREVITTNAAADP